MLARGCSTLLRFCPNLTAAPFPFPCQLGVVCRSRLSSLAPEPVTATAASHVDKNALSRLRKKTGYPFINCRKALEKFSGDELQAERWLREQAEKEGWSKALKLQTRPMSQGLIGVISNQKLGMMVEVNCETDFVAKNLKFQQLVATIAGACWQKAQQQLAVAGDAHEVTFTAEDILQLQVDGSRTLKDTIVAEISSIGENMAARRAVAIAAVRSGDHVGHYVHIAGTGMEEFTKHSAVALGKYASLVLVRQASNEEASGQVLSADETHSIATQLGQHIVGMRPSMLDDEAAVSAACQQPADVTPAAATRSHGDASKPQPAEAESRALLRQEFLMDPSQTVKDWLHDKNLEAVGFARFEVGEELPVTVSSDADVAGRQSTQA